MCVRNVPWQDTCGNSLDECQGGASIHKSSSLHIQNERDAAFLSACCLLSWAPVVRSPALRKLGLADREIVIAWHSNFRLIKFSLPHRATGLTASFSLVFIPKNSVRNVQFASWRQTLGQSFGAGSSQLMCYRGWFLFFFF